MSKVLFVLKVLFGLAIFVGGTWLTIMLVLEGLYLWSGLSGFIAIIGAIIPFLGNEKDAEESIDQPAFTPPKTTATQPASSSAQQRSDIPEDSMLRRHYLTHLQSLKEIENTPSPVVEIPQAAPAPVVETQQQAPEPPPVTPDAPVQQPAAVEIPEDSMLRRHFYTQIRTTLAAGLPPRPTDSTLKRHYDALLDTKIEQYLQG